MKIEQQVCALQQAKRLIALGVYAPSVFVYFEAPNHSGIALGNMYMRHIWILTGNPYEERFVNITPAYTVAELGEMLPAGFDTMKVTEDYPGNTFWRGYDDSGNDFPADTLYHNEAQCRAAMLIHLIESNLIATEEINKRLDQ